MTNEQKQNLFAEYRTQKMLFMNGYIGRELFLEKIKKILALLKEQEYNNYMENKLLYLISHIAVGYIVFNIVIAILTNFN